MATIAPNMLAVSAVNADGNPIGPWTVVSMTVKGDVTQLQNSLSKANASSSKAVHGAELYEAINKLQEELRTFNNKSSFEKQKIMEKYKKYVNNTATDANRILHEMRQIRLKNSGKERNQTARSLNREKIVAAKKLANNTAKSYTEFKNSHPIGGHRKKTQRNQRNQRNQNKSRKQHK